MKRNEFETGANNAVTNDIILTIMNDQKLYNQAMNFVPPFYIFVDHRMNQFYHISDNEIDQINFGFISEYIRARKTEIERGE